VVVTENVAKKPPTPAADSAFSSRAKGGKEDARTRVAPCISSNTEKEKRKERWIISKLMVERPETSFVTKENESKREQGSTVWVRDAKKRFGLNDN
jgi:hypothetical protein